MEIDLESDLRAWGNSLGLVIPAVVAKAHGLKPGQHVRLRLEFEAPRNDATRLPKWQVGNYDVRKVVDEEFGTRES